MTNRTARALTPVTPSAPDILDIVASAGADAKAKEVVALDLIGLSDVTRYFVIASGRSDRHVQGIVTKILENLSAAGQRPFAVEGYETGHWVVLDLGEVMVHVFYEPVRQHYDLEGLWSRGKRLALEIANHDVH